MLPLILFSLNLPGDVDPDPGEEGDGVYFGPAYFGPGYFGDSYFGTGDAPINPISIMGGIIGRFRATAALAALVPGDIHPGIPAGVTRIPWVNIHEIGDPHYEYVAGDPGYMIETARFQIDIAAPSLPQCWAIWLQLLATFSPAQIAADPIPLRSGRIFSTYLDGATTQPSPTPIKASPDANGRRVTRAYRVMGQMSAKATRPLAVTS